MVCEFSNTFWVSDDSAFMAFEIIFEINVGLVSVSSSGSSLMGSRRLEIISLSSFSSYKLCGLVLPSLQLSERMGLVLGLSSCLPVSG